MLKLSGRDVRSPMACWWSHWCFVLAEPQKVAGTSLGALKRLWKTLTLSQKVLPTLAIAMSSLYQCPCLHLQLRPAFLPAEGRRKGGEKSHRPLQGHGDGRGRQTQLSIFVGGPRFAHTGHTSCSPAMMRKERRQCGNGFHHPEGGGGGPGC